MVLFEASSVAAFGFHQVPVFVGVSVYVSSRYVLEREVEGGRRGIECGPACVACVSE